MKYLFPSLSLILTAVLLVACGSKEDPVAPVDPTVAVTGVSLNQTSLSLDVGGTASLTATVSPSNATNKTVTWTSSNAGVASVSGGVVTAVAEGSATITATAGGKSAKCEVTVQRQVIDVTGLSLNKTELTLAPGGTFQLEATVTPADATDKTVTWTSTDPAVVTVENGLVTAVMPGDAVIEAQAGIWRVHCTVSVRLPGSNEDYGYEDL